MFMRGVDIVESRAMAKRTRPRAARPTKLAAGPRGKRKSADVSAGRVRAAEGPADLTRVLVAALRAHGEIERVTHRFHTYPARMHPDAARVIIARLSGDPIVDPFCGGGTVLVEAMLAGRRAIGRDVSPVAVMVARARTRLCSQAELRTLQALAHKIARQADDLAPRAEPPTAVLPLRQWYGRRALGELSALYRLIEDMREPQRSLLRATLSSLLVKYSQRASDTSARRVEKEPPRGAVLKAFGARADELCRMLGELRAKVRRDVAPAEVAGGDARQITLPDDDRAQLICTSPPYPGTYDYLPLQHLRLAWMGHVDVLEQPADVEIGARRGFRHDVASGYRRWQEATTAWLGSARDALAPRGQLAILVGDGIADGKLLESRGPTVHAAREAGLSMVGGVSIERVDPATQLAKREHALVFSRATSMDGLNEPGDPDARGSAQHDE